MSLLYPLAFRYRWATFCEVSQDHARLASVPNQHRQSKSNCVHTQIHEQRRIHIHTDTCLYTEGKKDRDREREREREKTVVHIARTFGFMGQVNAPFPVCRLQVTVGSAHQCLSTITATTPAANQY